MYLQQQQSMASAAAGAPEQPVLVENERGKSGVWRYFAFPPNERGKAKDVDKPVCKHCNNAVATKSSSTSNLAKHPDRHPGPYNEFRQVSKSSVSNLLPALPWPAAHINVGRLITSH